MNDVIAGFERDPNTPRLRHIDGYLSGRELAALYRAADVGVFPYRAEGFAIPILEAMACGLPCIVPRFGACLDYCTAENAFFVEPRRIRVPVREEMAFNTFGFREQVEAVDFCEVPVTRLADALRSAFESGGAERQVRGEAAARLVHERWTWERSVERMLGLLVGLECRPARLR
jgi:glycosyltransferase involved in cell wall biosynthesis